MNASPRGAVSSARPGLATGALQSSDALRTLFSAAMSRMYQAEVPQYGALIALVAEVNVQTRRTAPELDRRLQAEGELDRLNLERHGAIRLGTARELGVMRRLFAVMGMAPVGYYDLSVAGVPVHSTAFRPVADEALARNPFRVFTSLLRLELIADEAVRREAQQMLDRRTIFTPDCLTLIETAEQQGGLTEAQGEAFIAEALGTFRWRGQATVSAEAYERVKAVHPLLADVACFAGPHINHLTPRTLDIEAAHRRMRDQGLEPKACIEGPPARKTPILLRQTSFKALQEPIAFAAANGTEAKGAHAARFGEIEQRGAALTPRGRALYDRLLGWARRTVDERECAAGYMAALRGAFEAFPDNEDDLRLQHLAYFRYSLTGCEGPVNGDLDDLVERGIVAAEPIVYEDFLPVSAAGIFRSNLGEAPSAAPAAGPDQAAFEAALGAAVADPFALYAEAEARSKAAVLSALGVDDAQ